VIGTFLLATVMLAQAEPAEAAAPKAEAAAANADLMAKVKALTRQLDAPQQAQREAAEKELIALGPDVLTLLPDITPRTPAEVRNRLTRVRNALMKAEIEAATKPTLVSLAGEMLTSAALAAIEQQTGNRLVDYRERRNQTISDPMIKVELKDVPFWEALDTVLDAASLTLDNYDEEGAALAYIAKSDSARPRLGAASYGGLFRLEPKRIEAVRDLRDSNIHALKLTTDVVWEPRVKPIVLEVPLGDISATDEQAAAIGIDQTEGTLEVAIEGMASAAEIEFPLQAPARSVKTLASLKGKITAVVLGKVESFEFANVDKLKSAELERGGVTVTVESCRKNGDIYDVSMRVRFDKAANALESHRGWIYDNESFMLDPKGQRIEQAGLEATLLDVNEVGLSYKFDLEGAMPAGHKFVYKTPAAVIKIPVDFELKNIDLP
jgi:hypothetical protein